MTKEYKEYFKNNATVVVETIDDSYGKFRYIMKGSEVEGFLERMKNEGLSDIDYCCRQEDEWCRKVLNLASWNWRHNLEWCLKMGFSYDGLIDWIIDNKKA